MNYPVSCLRLCFAISLACLAPWGGPALIASSGPAPTAGPGEKAFVLFMGVDIDVQQGRGLHRVKSVVGDSFVINADGKIVEVPTSGASLTMKVVPQLKLTDKRAVVNELKSERAYTPDNDPYNKWSAAQGGGAGGALVGQSAVRMGLAEMGVQVAVRSANTIGGPTQGVALGGPLAQVITSAEFNAASRQASSDMNNAGYMAARMQEELDKKLFDAVRLHFEVSAPRPMSDPYIVVVTNYRDKDDPPGTVKSWIFARELERLDEKPLKVRLLKGGFPAGFELISQQVHVYGSGRELGTNVSSKKVPLTRDEAHEYIVIDHLVTHKTETVVPAIALGVSRRDLAAQFSAEQLGQVIYVKVDRRGMPAGAFQDEKCSRPADDSRLGAIVGQVRFKPALQAGKAVDGVAKVKLADLAI